MRSFQAAGAGSQTSMPMPSEYERAVLSISAVVPGPTSSLTRHMSTAAVTGLGESTATGAAPLLTVRTATNEAALGQYRLPASRGCSGSGAPDVWGQAQHRAVWVQALQAPNTPKTPEKSPKNTQR